MSIPYLEDLRKKMKELLGSGTLEIDDMKTVSDQIYKIDDAISEQKDRWGLVNDAVREHRRLIDEAKDAQDRLAQARKGEFDAKADMEALKMVEGEKLLHRPLGRCSGGELQRVLLALALHPAPDLLVLDEPVSGVDQNGLQMFLDTVVRLKEHHHMAILLVSHDLNVVRQYADHVVLLDKTVLKQGKPDDVFASPEFQKVFGLGAKTLNAQRLHGAERWMGRKAETTEEEIARAAAVVDDETKGGRA